MNKDKGILKDRSANKSTLKYTKSIEVTSKNEKGQTKRAPINNIPSIHNLLYKDQELSKALNRKKIIKFSIIDNAWIINCYSMYHILHIGL